MFQKTLSLPAQIYEAVIRTMLRRLSPHIFVFLFNAIAISILFYDLIVYSNQIHYACWGDGFKNFFTIAWYLQHDWGAWFSGMNYPFGENIIYTDNQPIIAFLLKPLSFLFPSIHQHLRAIISLSGFYAVAFAGVCIYGSLRILKVPLLMAVFFSVPIALLSPQIQRIAGHYALAYSFFIPLLFWIMLSLMEFEKWTFIKLLLLILVNTIFVFIHLYYLAISIFLICPLILTYVLSGRLDLFNGWKKIAGSILSLVLPFLLLKIFLVLTDHVTDRPQSPIGFLSSGTNWEGIFFHPQSYLTLFINLFMEFNPHENLSNEGYLFIGTVTCCVILFTVFRILIKQKMSFSFRNLSIHTLLMLSALPAVFFALTLPFSIPSFEFFYDYMPPMLKQFRAPGRFGLIFYYAVTFFAVAELAHWELSKKKYGQVALSLIFILWLYEANLYAKSLKADFLRYAEVFDLEREYEEINFTLKQGKVLPNDFFGVMYFPYLLIGSEKLCFESAACYRPMKTALATGLPMLTGSMSRTSVSFSLEIASLMGDEFIPKNLIKEKYATHKPLLLVVGKDLPLSLYEQQLILKGKFIGETHDAKMFTLSLDAFEDKTNALNEMRKNAIADQHNRVVYRSFDEHSFSGSFFGNGALVSNQRETQFYYDSLSNAEDSTWYEFSMWLYADNKSTGMPAIYFSVVDERNNVSVSQHECLGKLSCNTLGSWVMIKEKFFLPDKRFKISMIGVSDNGVYDEFLIRPLDVNFVVKDSSHSTYQYLYNNYPVYGN